MRVLPNEWQKGSKSVGVEKIKVKMPI